MNDMMQFPTTVEEFMEQYKIVDTEQVYTNGAELVPIFRMKQWFDHIEEVNKTNDDTISRQAAIDAVMKFMPSLTTPDGCGQFDREIYETQEMFVDIGQALSDLPSTEQHGHWTLIDKGHNFYNWECSICGGSGRGDYLFCPYCGAVMDEDIPIEYFENGGI